MTRSIPKNVSHHGQALSPPILTFAVYKGVPFIPAFPKVATENAALEFQTTRAARDLADLRLELLVVCRHVSDSTLRLNLAESFGCLVYSSDSYLSEFILYLCHRRRKMVPKGRHTAGIQRVHRENG